MRLGEKEKNQNSLIWKKIFHDDKNGKIELPRTIQMHTRLSQQL